MGDNPTREAIEQALAGLVREQGQWIARDPVRVRTLLQHAFANTAVAQSRELDAAVAAVEYGVFDILSTSTDAAQVDGLVSRLDRERGLTTDEAQWAVSSWARAAGLPLVGGLATSGGTGTVALPPPGAAAQAPPQPQPPPASSPQQPQLPQQPAAAPYPPPQPQQPQPPPAQPGYQQPQQPQQPQPGYQQPPQQPYQQPGQSQPAAYGAAAGGYAAGPPPGAPPGAPGGPGGPGKGGGSQLPLILGIGALVVVLLIGAVVFLVTRGGEQAVGPGGSSTTASTAAATTVKKSTTTTEEEPPEDSTTRSTRRPTTTESSTTTSASTTTTEAPLQWTMFSDPAGKFTIEFPGEYRLQQSSEIIEGQNVGIFTYVSEAKGATYRFIIEELPPGYFFIDPQAVVDAVIANFTRSDAGNVVFRDPAAYAGNPSLYLHTKKADSETEIRGFITGNRMYVFWVIGVPDLTKADFAHFQASLQLK